VNESKYKKIALVSIVVGIILFFAGLSMAGKIPGTDLLLVYLVDAVMFSGLIAIMFGVLAGIGHLKQRSRHPKNQMRTVLLSSFVLLAILSGTFIPSVFAYVSSPIQSGLIYDEYYYPGQLCANYATITRYDASGGGNDPFFFPGIESHSDSGTMPYYWVTNLKITVNGTKPDGSTISGLEFTNLACMDSPHDSGSDPWYGVLAVLLDVIDDLSPPGASPLLQNGQAFSGVGYDDSSAWAEWQWNGFIGTRTDSKGLQFRFSLHCDPDLEGTYTLNIHHEIEIHAAIPSGGYVLAADEDIYETITYYFGSPTLSISASSGGTTDPAPETYTYDYGSSVTVTASAYAGYTFWYWKLDGENDGTDNPITVTMDSDHTLTPRFNPHPNTPSQPSGPASGYVETSYSYSTSTTDPEGDNLKYRFYWDDGLTTTIGWYPSGATVSASHAWGSPGIYYVKVKAMDSLGAWSDWSSCLTVNINATLSISATEGGTTDPAAGTYTYNYGSYVICNATADSGYVFDHWTVNGYTVEPNPITVQMTCDRIVYAYFAKVYTLSISVSSTPSGHGTTDPPPGTYTYKNGTSVQVTAIPDGEVVFTQWILDGQCGYYANPINVSMNSNHSLTAVFLPPPTGGGDGCPTLFVWNGTGYVDYGVIDIHDASGEDVIQEVLVEMEDVGLHNYKAYFRLREGWPGLNFSESVIDQVKLYAVDSSGNRHLCPLISATHSNLGNVWLKLLFSDDRRSQILLLETIDLKFIVPYEDVQSFTFVIEGCNQFKQ